MDVKSVTPDSIFRVFTCVANDPPTLLLDVRHNKEFKKKHVMQAYSIRVSADGRALVDYSKNSYDMAWSPDCWWDKHVIIYGDTKLKKDHPVAVFLSKDQHAKSVSICKAGYEEIEKQYPFICTQSVKANSFKRYPAEIIPGLLYLGDWSHAQAIERLDELNVKRIITIHNNPDDLRCPAHIKHLKFTMADVETENISACFNPAYEFITAAASARHGVLVHCGAGVSRSAALVMSYVMRSMRMSAAKALALCTQRRSCVAPNNGFWRMLCALEGELGVADRSDPHERQGGRGADAPIQLDKDAAGKAVEVVFVPAGAANVDRKRARPNEEEGRRVRSESDKAGGHERRHGRRKSNDHDEDSTRFKGNEEAAPQRSACIVLTVLKEDQVVGRYEIEEMLPHQQLVIGRLPSCDITLEHLSISRQHAQITMNSQGQLFVTDLGSGHGTNVDDVWIRKNAAKQLQVGSRIKFGASTRVFKVTKVTKVVSGGAKS